MFDVNSKIAQTKLLYLKKFHCQKVDSTRNGKPWRLSMRFQTLTWRLGEMVQNLESPGLSARVDSPVYTVKPHFNFFGHLLNKDTSLLLTVCFVPGERKSLSYP